MTTQHAEPTTDRPRTDHKRPGDQPPTNHEPMLLVNAAKRLGISGNAVLQRVKRGTLYSERRDGIRFIWVPIAEPTDPTDQEEPTTNRPASSSDLVAFMEKLVRENGDLRATAAIWQERHDVIRERLEATERRAILAERRLEDLGQPIALAKSAGVVIAMPPGDPIAELEQAETDNPEPLKHEVVEVDTEKEPEAVASSRRRWPWQRRSTSSR